MLMISRSFVKRSPACTHDGAPVSAVLGRRLGDEMVRLGYASAAHLHASLALQREATAQRASGVERQGRLMWHYAQSYERRLGHRLGQKRHRPGISRGDVLDFTR